MELVIREPKPGDGEGLARAWMDAGRYYAELSLEDFQVPQSDGLAASFEEDLAKPRTDDETWRRGARRQAGRMDHRRIVGPAENAASSSSVSYRRPASSSTPSSLRNCTGVAVSGRP